MSMELAADEALQEFFEMEQVESVDIQVKAVPCGKEKAKAWREAMGLVWRLIGEMEEESDG